MLHTATKMRRPHMRLNLIRYVAVAIMVTASIFAHAQLPQGGGYASVHGLKMYYEIHGQGQPLILIHGGLGSSGMFDAILPELSKGHKVIAVDLQAHGRTADVDRPLSYEAMADDIAELIRYLGIPAADVMGYSVGGEVALRTAIQHPEVVRKLVIVSATYRRDGWYPEILAGESQLNPQTAEQMKQTPIYQSYAQIAPRARCSFSNSWAAASGMGDGMRPVCPMLGWQFSRAQRTIRSFRPHNSALW